MPTYPVPTWPGRSSKASGGATASGGSIKHCTSTRRSSTTDPDARLTTMTRWRRAAALTAPLLLLSVFGAGSREPQLYVSNEIPNTIAVVSPRTNAVVATIPVGQRPRGMALSPDRRTVYVALGQDDALGVVDVASGRVTRTVPADRDPRLVGLSPDGKVAYGSDGEIGP